MGKLDQKVAIVTGAARGIGKQIALTFAGEGADVTIADIIDMEGTAQEIKDLGRKVMAIKTDISRKAEVKNLIDTTIDNFKRIDILVNNAGAIQNAPLLEMSEEDWDLVQSVNLKGTFLCCQAVAKHMLARKYGKIINISSTAGVRMVVNAGLANYASSKAGIIQLTRVCAVELSPQGINVNAIAPGAFPSDMHYIRRTPEQAEELRQRLGKHSLLGRIGTLEELANVALFLASDDSSYITGQVICVDGGQGAILC
jgi:NAD(P)-dependent dehydrogenase (short-subunit alcohol dehydrogenase family)